MIPNAARVAAGGLATTAAVAAVMLWLAGAFEEEVPAGPPLPPPAAARLEGVAVEVTSVPVFRDVVGTIGAEHETAVASQLLGRVSEVRAAPGQAVAAGELLARLEDAEHRARLEQAEALLAQARDRHERLERERRAGTASEAALVEARAAREAARARVDEARVVLGWVELRAPGPGTVIERLCEVGDTVTPGRTLVRLYDRLQLVATAPESLASALAVGQQVAVRVDALRAECAGQVREVVPEADPLSRAFRVKVGGPCHAGVIPGMFGRMRVPQGERVELRVPAAAVRRVGQVTLVFRLLPDGRPLRQFVHTGGAVAQGDRVVITSGLQPGDRVVADARTVE